MIEIKDIPDRITERLTEADKLKIAELSRFINEDDLSKIQKFARDAAVHHVNFVTAALITPEWEVLFQRKRKTQRVDRRLY